MPTPSVLTRHPTTARGADDEIYPISSTPLGHINALAIDLGGLSVPRGLLDQRPADAPATLAYLRNTLLLSTTPPEVKDRTWCYIGETARTAGPRRPDWNLFALGMAYPGLRKRARKLAPQGVSFDRVKAVHFRLSVEFLLALHRLDLHTPNVASRLLGAAYDQASGRKTKDEPRMVSLDLISHDDLHDALSRDAPPADSRRHIDPSDVLNRLVAQTNRPDHRGLTLTEEHAALLAHTYLDGRLLSEVAAELGLSLDNASKRRTRAAGIVARLLGHPDHAGP